MSKSFVYKKLLLMWVANMFTPLVYLGVLYFIYNNSAVNIPYVDAELRQMLLYLFIGLSFVIPSLGILITNKLFKVQTLDQYYLKKYLKLMLVHVVSILGMLISILMPFKDFNLVFFIIPILYGIAFFPRKVTEKELDRIINVN